MNKLEELINELSRDATELVVDPDTKEQLIKKGLPISKTEILPIEERIDQMFSIKRVEATKIIPLLPMPPNFPLPNINALYNEIFECILFGLNGAAITLCGILVEFVLKQAAYFVENGRNFSYNKSLWDEFESITLAPAIRRARELDLISDQEATSLNEFKDEIRNPYNHYNIKKIVKNVEAKGIKKLDIKTLKVETLNVRAEDDPVLHTFAKRFVDKSTVVGIFKYADRVVRSLLSKIF